MICFGRVKFVNFLFTNRQCIAYEIRIVSQRHDELNFMPRCTIRRQ